MDPYLHGKLIQLAFEKAEIEISKQAGVQPSTHKMGEWLSEYIMEHNRFSYVGRNLTERKRKFEEGKEVSLNHPEVLQALSHLIGYPDYAAFFKEHGPKTPPKQSKSVWQRYRLVLFGCILLMVFVAFGFYINRERWMVWEEDHYTETSFDAPLYEMGKLKVYDQELIDHFRKVNPDSIHEFFTDKKEALIWYGKNTAGELEYFNYLGKHPETGKALKDITPYMIKTHIRSDPQRDSLQGTSD
jgi:hypothetical protein